MKPSILLVSYGAALAAAGPLSKRVMETEVVVEWVTRTVTEDTFGPTTLPGEVIPDLHNYKTSTRTRQGHTKLPAIQPTAEPEPEPKPEPIPPLAPTLAPIPEPVTTPEPVATPTPEPKPQPKPEPKPEPETTTASKPEPTPEPAPQSAPKTTAKSAPQSTPSTGNAYSDAAIKEHNIHRAVHSAPALTWNQDLADAAQQLADTCVFAHDV